MEGTTVGDLQYQGRFVWRDLMTTDLEKSKEFFVKLFGWTTEVWDTEKAGTYTMFKHGDGMTFGGIVQLNQEHGAPSHWISYISTEDVDDFCSRATDLGATIDVQPADIPSVGRWAIMADSQGARFSPFMEAERTPIVEPESVQTHGGIAWNELMTADTAAAIAFYTRMFGWTTEVMDVGTGPYTLLRNGSTLIGGIGQKPDDMPASAWTIYFEVDDIDRAVTEIETLGGHVLFPPMEVPAVGRLSWATDPTGATFAVIQSAPVAQPV